MAAGLSGVALVVLVLGLARPARAELEDAYDDIGAEAGSVVEQREVARAFLGAALVALGARVAGSFVWAARLP